MSLAYFLYRSLFSTIEDFKNKVDIPIHQGMLIFLVQISKPVIPA